MGWILLGLGIAAFAMCYLVFLLNRWIIEGFIAAGIGIFLFRGGSHLLKVAMAARAARDIRREVQTTRVARQVRPAPALGTNGRARKSVVPGMDESGA
jgi:hypothetical protein